MKMKSLYAVCILALISFSAAAQTKTPRVTHRQVNQQRRIHQGVKNGELTRRETAHLEAREAKIQHDKRVAKADGKVTGQERAKLNREENRASRAIRRQKHDAQVRH